MHLITSPLFPSTITRPIHTDHSAPDSLRQQDPPAQHLIAPCSALTPASDHASLPPHRIFGPVPHCRPPETALPMPPPSSCILALDEGTTPRLLKLLGASVTDPTLTNMKMKTWSARTYLSRKPIDFPERVRIANASRCVLSPPTDAITERRCCLASPASTNSESRSSFYFWYLDPVCPSDEMLFSGENVCKRCRSGKHDCIVKGRKPRIASNFKICLPFSLSIALSPKMPNSAKPRALSFSVSSSDDDDECSFSPFSKRNIFMPR
ncbi:hypothetical protein F5148DRAFT_476576 [Russula earlei]|uniref:Uncharacterized protein n=1 Tax=Russula earlei TaxID=71964 RepID=A0ACC0TY96_9AGAM|nr:hypothetical protein F5148DRAFT_476576 [Russula earlei]